MFCQIFQKVTDNQTMKFGQLVEYSVRNIFFQKIKRKMRQGNKLQTPFFLKKDLDEVKQVVTTVSKCCGCPGLGHTTKLNSMKLQNADAEIRSISIFLKKGLGLVSPPQFARVILKYL